MQACGNHKKLPMENASNKKDSKHVTIKKNQQNTKENSKTGKAKGAPRQETMNKMATESHPLLIITLNISGLNFPI